MTAIRSPFGAIAYAPHLFWDNQSDNTLWNTDFRGFPSGLRNEAHPASWCGCLPHPPGAYGMKRIFVRLTFGLAVSPFPPANQRPTQDYARFWHTAPFPTLTVVKKASRCAWPMRHFSTTFRVRISSCRGFPGLSAYYVRKIVRQMNPE